MIHCDFETRSTVNLLTAGTYNYAYHPSTDVLCLGWAVGDGDVFVWGRNGPPPTPLLEAIDSGVLIAAWNAQFERLIWNNILVRYGFPEVPLEQFYCVAALARARGYPGKLARSAEFAGLPIEKDMEGHRLMMKMCKPLKTNGDTVEWYGDIDDHMRLRQYCIDDVHVERAMNKIFIPFSDEELADYHVSERINDRGVCVDVELAQCAVESFTREQAIAIEKLSTVTGGVVTKPTQRDRILNWLDSVGLTLPNLTAETVNETLERTDLSTPVRDVLNVRREQAKAAVSKFSAILARQHKGIVHGLFMFRGAGQTGRFSSLGVQVHNLVRESAPKLIPILKKHGVAGLRCIGDPVHLLAKMVRPAFIAAPGKTFLIGDYAQIEARIVAWLADEVKLLKVFEQGEDVYCAFGKVAYKRTITKADTKERLASKHCVLGLGFGGGEAALARSLKAQGGVVLPDDELTRLVQTYRKTYSKVKTYWYRLSDAVILAMFSKGTIIPVGHVSYLYDGEHLWCKLPSGRLMCYPYPRIVKDEYGDSVEYKRGNHMPAVGADWPHVRLWHGVLIENIAQGVALDLLVYALRSLQNNVRIHVHDEVVSEVDICDAPDLLPEHLAIMEITPDWAADIPVAAEGKISPVYVK